MVKRLTLKTNVSEDVEILGIVSHLKDYRLAYHINNELNIHLKRFDDLVFNEKENGFSWYYFSRGENYYNITLISNGNLENKLITEHKIDYLILIKNSIDESSKEFISNLRKINDITMVYQIVLSKIKNIGVLLEAFEMHELKQVIRPKRKPFK